MSGYAPDSITNKKLINIFFGIHVKLKFIKILIKFPVQNSNVYFLVYIRFENLLSILFHCA